MGGLKRNGNGEALLLAVADKCWYPTSLRLGIYGCAENPAGHVAADIILEFSCGAISIAISPTFIRILSTRRQSAL
jgi:hypothetical protein